jgi:hypothetical protein
MEEGIFVRDPAVAGTLREHFVESRLHGDAPTDYPARVIKPLQDRYVAGNQAAGIYVAVDPATEQPLATLYGTRPEAFLGFLKEALAAR